MKILDSLDIQDNAQSSHLPVIAGRVVNFLADSVKLLSEKVNLDPSKKLLIDQFLKTRKITVYLDDLDRGWEGRPFDIKRISALLNAVRDMSSDNPGLQFRVALRSDVYFLVRTADESTDKVEGSVVWYSWSNHEILVLLIKRIETFFGRQVDEAALLRRRQYDIASYLDSVFEPKFTGRGHWENAPMYKVLMSLIRKRPRDLVKLCSAAAREAYNTRSSLIGTKHFEAVFEDYSQGRIQDAINEYRTELPELERLLMGMKPNKRERTTKESFYFTTDQLLNKIGNVQQGGPFRFAKQQEATKQELAQFLYKINFLTARKDLDNGEVKRRFFEENRYLSNRFADFGYAWEIHPAYRWALQPDVATQVSVRLTVDEDHSNVEQQDTMS